MQNLKTLFRNGSIALFGTVAASSAFAEVDVTAATTAIQAAEGDASSVGSVVIAAVAALVVIGLVIGIVKKL